MNFENLYSRVFVTEADEDVLPGTDRSTAPTPDNYEVDPLPVPKTTGSSVAKLEEYIAKLQEFLEVLNGTSTDSLQRFVVGAEGQNSLLKGIADETRDDITDMAGKLATLVQTLKGFVSTADLRRKQLQATTGQF
jgi:hypothetical protein